MLDVAYNTLLQEAGDEVRCHLLMAPGSDVMLWNAPSPTEAEISLIFCICVLAEIGNAKNNIIGVRWYSVLLMRLHCHVLVSKDCTENGAIYCVNKSITHALCLHKPVFHLFLQYIVENILRWIVVMSCDVLDVGVVSKHIQSFQ